MNQKVCNENYPRLAQVQSRQTTQIFGIQFLRHSIDERTL